MQSDLPLSLIRDHPMVLMPPTSRSIIRENRPASLNSISLSPEQFHMAAAVSQPTDTISPVDAFPDLSAFTVDAASIFDYSQPCDTGSVVLTPHSGSLSPPMSSVGRKIMHSQGYHPSNGAPSHQQQPTPPTSSKPFWTQNSFDMSSVTTSQSSPSLGAPAPVSADSTGGFDSINNYMSNHSLHDNLGTSANTYYPPSYRVPAPKPDLGDKNYYSQHSTQQHGPTGPTHQYTYQTLTPAMGLMMSHTQQQQHQLPSNHHLAQAHNSLPQPLPPSQQPFQLNTSSRSQTMTDMPPVRRNNRVTKSRAPASNARKAANSRPKNITQKVPLAPFDINPLQFKPGVPDIDRTVLELRRRYDGNKGKNMWEAISEAYKHFQTVEAGKPDGKKEEKEPARATLQMRVTRSRSRWIQWKEEETQLLREAWAIIEDQRYELIRAKFEELGGGSYMAWNSRNVECKLVEEGLENIYYHEEGRELIRARFKSAADHKDSNAKALVSNIRHRSFDPMAAMYRADLSDPSSQRTQAMSHMPDMNVDTIMSDIEAVRGLEMWDNCEIDPGMQ